VSQEAANIVSEMWNKLLKQLGRAPRAGRPAPESLPFRAVSVAPTRASCPAAVAIRDKRFLVAEAPTLPLPMCTWPLSCPCKLKVHDDRRARPRRESAADELKKARKERRQTTGRRATDR
jgi:hypothetical protein